MGWHIQNRRSGKDIDALQICEAGNQGIGITQAETVLILDVPMKAKRKHRQ